MATRFMDKKILVDGGLRERALGFLIWKYRLDDPNNTITIDHLFLSHGDKDHVEGLIPLLNNAQIDVTNIYHNGIALFDSGFDTDLGDLSADEERLVTIHDGVNDLNGLDLASGDQAVFADWIQAVRDSGATYGRLDSSDGTIDIGDPDIDIEILGPRLEPDGSFEWFSNKSHTINGHSLVFRLTYNFIRTFFSGDLNEDGGDHLLAPPGAALSLDSHIFKAPHHGSHEFSMEMFEAIRPMITIVSSGEVPDHGHPRANFLGAIGHAGRIRKPLLFSTALAALFTDAADPDAEEDDTLTANAIDFSSAASNAEARQRFKKLLPGIINIRTNGEEMYAFRRVAQGYAWESYGPIAPAP